MPKIKVLEKHMAQLIAAGEVVERPASVVKELLENSIDSGATRIEVEIRSGGVKFLKVTDNGHGIVRQDVKTAFLRHATSKISNPEDLYKIGTLGFRGEALASICAVSKTEMITRTKSEEDGTRIVIHGGEQKFLEDIGCAAGTIIVVRDIFYNTPARMKFLKKDVAEANAIAEVIDKLALSHPEISFKFIREGKEAIITPGDEKISSVIYSVYGKNFFGGMIPVDYTYENVKISGFVSIPEKSKPTRTSQNFFLNGRYVKIKTAAAALTEAFKGRIMVGKYPYCVLYLEAPFTAVDVNVHPTKTEVKFVNDKPIFEAVYYGVKTALTSGVVAPFSNGNSKNLVVSDSNPNFAGNFLANEIVKTVVDKAKEQRIESKKEITIDEKFDYGLPHIFTPRNDLPENFEVDAIARNNNKLDSGVATIPFNEEPSKSLVPEEKTRTNLKIIGEIFKCYIIVQSNENEIIFIDKHAAHERFIYEKLKENKNESQTQILLEPVITGLEKSEHLSILENLNILEKAGYLIEDFGSSSVIVRGIPQYLPQIEISNSISEIASNLLTGKKSIDTNLLDWIYHNIACRAAVKAGKNSDYTEILNLINNLQSHPELTSCPHGRPIYVSLEKSFFEKKFKRT